MPKELKEIKAFNTGNISSVSERDISDNTPSFSLNIDSNSEQGVLDAIKNDKVISIIDGSITRFEDNVSWKSVNLNNNDSDGPNLSRVAINNIDIFEDNANPIIKFQGTKGRTEHLNVTNIEPYFERVSTQTFNPASDIEVSDNSITYATDSSEMSGSSGSFLVISGLVVGDYFSLLNGTFTGRDSAEIMKVVSTDTNSNKIYIKRRCFGTKSVTISNGVQHNFYLNRRTLDGIQYSTKIGTCELYGWSDYSGNNINGSSNYIQKTDSTKAKFNGKIDTSSGSQTITYNATDKTITFASLSPSIVDEFKFNEGDNITIYHNNTSTTNGQTFKILKKEKVSTSIVLTVDAAPSISGSTDAEGTDTVYIESNLLKNHTFQHVVSDGTTTPGSSAIYKCNDWIHKASSYSAGGEGELEKTFNILENETDTKVSRVASGGYWDDTQPGESGDASALYYPFDSSDAYIKIENDYGKVPYSITGLGATLIDTYLQFEGSSVSTKLNEHLAKNDIISFEDSTFDGNTEYMRVLSVKEDIVEVERGLFGTSLVAVASGASIVNRRPWKCRSPRIMQSVESKYMKPGQRYKLCFYAQDEENAKAFSRGAVAITFNGGYINSGGVWTPYSSSNDNGYLSLTNNIVAQENKWIEFSSLAKPYGDTCELENGLDNIWRKFCLYFEMPSFDLKTNIDIEIANRGKNHDSSNTSYLCIDLVNLCEDTIAYSYTKNSTNISSVGNIGNKGSKEFVLYDSIKNKLNVLDLSSQYSDSSYGINYSPYASEQLKNGTINIPMVSNNRELHIGFGGTSNSTAPQWLGHINRKVFGKDLGDSLYQDEDTVHTYDKITSNSLTKVCLAGEYEYIKAYYNHTTSTADGDGTTLGENTLRFYLTHSVNTGDNIIVRRWGDTVNDWDGSGIWVVTDATTSTSYFDCKRYTTKDANPTTTGGATTEIKMNYRPYHYYGCKSGDPYIYRIWPEARITDGLAVDTVYTAGKIEKSQPISLPINSICTYYAKEGTDNTAATNGGRIYALSSNTDEIVVLDVNAGYNQWEKINLTEYGPMTLVFKSYKWSNETIDGDLASDVGVFGGTAVESTPTIEYAGRLTDILETKGTKETFNTAVTTSDYTVNSPYDLDTRLWVQSSPEGERNTFTEGSRFLFCGLTTETNTNGSSTLFLGDRTPATTSIISAKSAWRRTTDSNGDNRSRFVAAPGFPNYYGGQGDTEGDNHKTNAFYNFGITDTHAISQYSPGQRLYSALHKDAREAFYNDSAGNDDDEFFTTSTPSYVSNLNLGWNIGWDISNDKDNLDYTDDRVSFQIPKHALFAMGDNDGDGMIDGTGIVTCNTTSLPTTLNSRKMGPYGEKHRRVTSHCVGLIGASNKNWWRNWGRLSMYRVGTQGNNSNSIADWGLNSPNVNTNLEGQTLSVDAPEKISIEKFIAVCPDLHFGDMEMESSLTAHASDSTTQDSGNQTRVHLINGQTTANLQAGDPIFIDDSNYGSTYISKIISADEFDVPVAFNASVHDSVIYPMTPFKQFKTSTSLNSGCLPQNQHYHWAHDLTEPTNPDVFTKVKLLSEYESDESSPVTFPGNFTKTFYSTPTRWGAGYNPSELQGFLPGFIFKLSKLNYKAGLMLRPFDLAENTFEDMVVGNGLYVDMPSYPETVYRKKLSNNTHSSLGTTDNENEFASRLFISTDAGADDDGNNLANIYTCDLSLKYPFNLNHIDIEHQDSWSSPDAHQYNEGEAWDIIVAGKLTESTSYVDSASSTYPCADLHPYVVLPGYTNNELSINQDILKGDSKWRDDNAFSGLCISILDAVTGKVQTRQIVYSDSAGGGTTDATDINIMVHYPFGHRPAQNDYYYIWSPELVNTAPVRLYKETALDHGLPNALIGDPTLLDSIYKNNGTMSDLSSTSTLATATTTNRHNLSNNDLVRITSPTTTGYEGVYSITVTGPKTFTYPITADYTDSVTDASWESVSNDTSTDNPLKLVNLSNPLIKTNFGGLDMRKLKGGAVSAIADDSDDIRLTSADHRLSVGDSITHKSDSTTAQDGVYVVKEGAGALPSATEDTFDVVNTTSTNTPGDWTTNQFELILAETQGVGRMGEIRSGLNSWDKGNISDNIIRYDSATTSDDDRFLQIIEDSISIQAASEATTSGYFLKNNRYEYKVSFIYDGYQEGPLSQSVWSFGPNDEAYSKVELSINIKAYSSRLSHICIYRRDNEDNSFRLVKEISTQSGWINSEDTQLKKIVDTGRVGASYEARTTLSETLDTIKLKYGLSAEIDGYLFAGDCYHEKIEDASNQIFRSKPGMYSIFDYSVDFLQLKSKPTAIINFNGRLFAFDENNIYKINPQSLMIEDTYEGVGCLSSNSLVVTEYGMFFADKNGAYIHDGLSPKKISSTIHKKGNTDVDFESKFGASNTDNIRDFSWESIIKNDKNIKIIYDSSSSSILHMFSFPFYTEKGDDKKSIINHYTWAYNIISNRWDLWEICSDSIIGTPFINEDSKVCIPIDNAIYEYRGGSDKRDYTWISKKLTMGQDSIVKVFNKIKVNGIESNLNLNSTNRESKNRLLVLTSTGLPTTSYIKSSDGHSEYKLNGSSKKGRWVQFKAQDMTESLDSVGIIFRRKSTK